MFSAQWRRIKSLSRIWDEKIKWISSVQSRRTSSLLPRNAQQLVHRSMGQTVLSRPFSWSFFFTPLGVFSSSSQFHPTFKAFPSFLLPRRFRRNDTALQIRDRRSHLRGAGALVVVSSAIVTRFHSLLSWNMNIFLVSRVPDDSADWK